MRQIIWVVLIIAEIICSYYYYLRIMLNTEFMLLKFACLGVPPVDSTVAENVNKEKTLWGIVPVWPLPYSRSDTL